MAGNQYPLLTYSDTVTLQIAMADYISTLGPWEVPMVSYFGLNGDPGRFRLVNWPSTETRWFEDQVKGLTTGLQATLASDATTFAVTASDGYKVRIGQILQIGDEYLYVTTLSTDTVTVTRALWGSTAATAASDSTVYIRSQASLENETSTTGGVTVPGTATNYTQIYRDVVVLSESEQQQSRYGISDPLAFHSAKKLKEMMRLFDQGFFYNVATAGSATTPRTWGGLATFCTANTTDLSSAAITETAINNELDTIWTAGGSPTLMVCGSWVKRKINDMYKSYVRTERTERTGGVIIDKIQTQYGELDVLMDRYCPATTAYFLTPDEIAWLPYREFKNEDLAKTGDGRIWQIVGEYTFVMRQPKMHGKITSISTTS